MIVKEAFVLGNKRVLQHYYNNLDIYCMKKFMRDISYVGVRNALRKSYPELESYYQQYRTPVVPRIVVYSKNKEDQGLADEYALH